MSKRSAKMLGWRRDTSERAWRLAQSCPQVALPAITGARARSPRMTLPNERHPTAQVPFLNQSLKNLIGLFRRK